MARSGTARLKHSTDLKKIILFGGAQMAIYSLAVKARTQVLVTNDLLLRGRFVVTHLEQEKTLKNIRSILVGLCLVGLSITAWGQNVNRPVGSGIPGYLDPLTGTFRPVPLATDSGSEDAPPVTPTTGKIVLNLTVTLQTTFGTGETYSCGLTASTLDISSSLSFVDSYQIAATKNGNTLTCTITLPYSWALVSRGSDMMMVAYSVNAVNGTGAVPVRIAEHGVAHLIVPVSGTTTTYTLSTVI
jgi:hypothetical protein